MTMTRMVELAIIAILVILAVVALCGRASAGESLERHHGYSSRRHHIHHHARAVAEPVIVARHLGASHRGRTAGSTPATGATYSDPPFEMWMAITIVRARCGCYQFSREGT